MEKPTRNNREKELFLFLVANIAASGNITLLVMIPFNREIFEKEKPKENPVAPIHYTALYAMPNVGVG